MRHISVPQYEGLSLRHIAEWCTGNYPEVFDYMPDAQDMHKVSCSCICNVIATVIGAPFSEWVRQQIETRNAEMAKKQDIMVEMDPEIAVIFRASTKVSRKS